MSYLSTIRSMAAAGKLPPADLERPRERANPNPVIITTDASESSMATPINTTTLDERNELNEINLREQVLSHAESLGYPAGLHVSDGRAGTVVPSAEGWETFTNMAGNERLQAALAELEALQSMARV